MDKKEENPRRGKINSCKNWSETETKKAATTKQKEKNKGRSESKRVRRREKRVLKRRLKIDNSKEYEEHGDRIMEGERERKEGQRKGDEENNR